MEVRHHCSLQAPLERECVVGYDYGVFRPQDLESDVLSGINCILI